jgi:hypothetical protein
LFRDLSDFTSDIIGKHDERLMSIQQTTTVLNNPNSHLQVKTEPAQRVGNEEDNSGMHDIVEVDTIKSSGVASSVDTSNDKAMESMEGDKLYRHSDVEAQRQISKLYKPALHPLLSSAGKAWLVTSYFVPFGIYMDQ